MDSTTTAAIALRRGFDVYALSIRYGQRHVVELEAAKRVAASLGITRHVVIDIDLRAFGGSALTAEIAVPKDTPPEVIGTAIPATYVPARNTIFLSLALAWAETLGANDIFLGANALDYSGYPDCRPEYIEAFERMANLATKAGVEGGRHHDSHSAHRSVQARDRSPGPRARARLRHHLDVLRPRARRRRLRALRGLSPAPQGVQGGGSGGSGAICIGR